MENTSVVLTDPSAETVWARVLDHARHDLADSSFNMWFADVRAQAFRSGVLELVAPSEYVRDWLAKNYVELIRGAAEEMRLWRIGAP